MPSHDGPGAVTGVDSAMCSCLVTKRLQQFGLLDGAEAGRLALASARCIACSLAIGKPRQV